MPASPATAHPARRARRSGRAGEAHHACARRGSTSSSRTALTKPPASDVILDGHDESEPLRHRRESVATSGFADARRRPRPRSPHARTPRPPRAPRRHVLLSAPIARSGRRASALAASDRERLRIGVDRAARAAPRGSAAQTGAPLSIAVASRSCSSFSSRGAATTRFGSAAGRRYRMRRGGGPSAHEPRAVERDVTGSDWSATSCAILSNPRCRKLG